MKYLAPVGGNFSTKKTIQKNSTDFFAQSRSQKQVRMGMNDDEFFKTEVIVLVDSQPALFSHRGRVHYKCTDVDGRGPGDSNA